MASITEKIKSNKYANNSRSNLNTIKEELRSEIKKRKSIEKELSVCKKKRRFLTSELVSAEDKERRRIAINLHDRIGQDLSSLNLKLREFKNLISSPDLTKEFDTVINRVRHMIHQTRSLIVEISPPILYEMGFPAAIGVLAEQIQDQQNIPIKLRANIKKMPEMDIRFHILIFQITRELILNVAKHARAQNVEISILKSAKDLRIKVEDDGIGMDTSKLNFNNRKSNGFGLFSIRERLDNLDGCLIIDSKRRNGTRATVIIPLKNLISSASPKTSEEHGK